MNMYSGDKLEALAAFLNIDVSIIQVWSDNSLTIDEYYTAEYYVAKGKHSGEKLGRINGFNIYKKG